MVQSRAGSVAQYLAELPPDRRAVVGAVRKLVREHLPQGYIERMNWGMISYEVPLSRLPHTYNGQPLCYAALAAQKNHYALYLMAVAIKPEVLKRLRAAFADAGKKLDLGKSCLRFKRLEDLPLAAVGAAIAALPLEDYVAFYQATRPAKRH